MDSRKDFLIAAVSDAQANIRALDVKLAALLVAVLAPIPMLPAISECFAGVYARWGGICIGTVLVLFSASWVMAVLCYARSIGAISSPNQHILNGNTSNGAFYGPGIYSLSLLDTVVNRKAVVSAIDPSTHLQKMPATRDDIEREMAFEHLKLIYIRDIKLHRLSWGFRFSAVAATIGSLLFVTARYYVKQCGP